MTSESLDQATTVTLIFEGLAEPWYERLKNFAEKFGAKQQSQSALIDECRSLILEAESEPVIEGTLRLLLAQALIDAAMVEGSEETLHLSIDESLRAQRLLDRQRDEFRRAICAFNIATAHELIAAGLMGDEAVRHLRDAAHYFEHASRSFQSAATPKLLAQTAHRLGIVQGRLGISLLKPDMLGEARSNLRLAAQLYRNEGLVKSEIDAICISAEAEYQRAEVTGSTAYAVEAIKVFLVLDARQDLQQGQKLKIMTGLAHAMIFAAIRMKELIGLREAVGLLRRVALDVVYDENPLTWLSAHRDLGAACMKLAIWGLQWKVEPLFVDEAISILNKTADLALQRCDASFPEHRRDLITQKLAAISLRITRDPPENKNALITQLTAMMAEQRVLSQKYPWPSQPTLEAAQRKVAERLKKSDWKGAAGEAEATLRRFEPKDLFWGTPATSFIQLRYLSAIGHMAAYAQLMMGEIKAALELSEASKSRFMQLAIALDTLSSRDDFGRLFRRVREDWLAADRDLKRLDHLMTQTHNSQRLTELMAQKRVLSTAFSAIANRLGRMLSQIPPPAIPVLDNAIVKQAIPPDGVIVSVISTDEGGAGIVVSGQVPQLGYIPLPKLTSEAIEGLFGSRRQGDGWSASYQEFRENSEARGGSASSKDLREWSDAVLSMGAQLWQLLWEPLHTHLAAIGMASGSHVILILPGVLGSLPVSAAWRLEDGKRRFVVEDWTISTAPSVQSLAGTQRGNREDGNGVKLLVCGDEVDQSAYAQLPTPPTSLFGAGYASALAAIRSGTFRYWIFGCHGVWDMNDPRESRLLISQTETLTVSAIQAQPLDNCRLALLGACESGVLDPSGRLSEQIGLPSAFVEAGVTGVIGTLWLVGGPIDFVFNNILHQNLEHGISPAAALRAEQLRLITQMNTPLGDRELQPPPPKERFGMPVEMLPTEEPFDPSLPGFWAAFQFTGT